LIAFLSWSGNPRDLEKKEGAKRNRRGRKRSGSENGSKGGADARDQIRD